MDTTNKESGMAQAAPMDVERRRDGGDERGDRSKPGRTERDRDDADGSERRKRHGRDWEDDAGRKVRPLFRPWRLARYSHLQTCMSRSW